MSTKTRPRGPCYINQLPEEVLIVIFRLALERHRKRYRAQRRLIKVCSRWHRVMMEATELWANIHTDMSLQTLSIYLTRSKTALLDVFCNDTRDLARRRTHGDWKYEPFFSKLLLESNRFQRLKIFQPSIREMIKLWDDLPSYLPNVVEVDLRGGGPSPSESQFLDLICPRVRDISIRNITWNWHRHQMSAGGLRSLHLIGTCIDLEPLLGSSPQMHILVLDQLEEYTGM